MLKEMCEVGIRTGFIKVRIRTSGVAYFYERGINVENFIAHETNTGISETRLGDKCFWLVSCVFSVDYSTDI
jgi:hypothetical protein